MSENGTLDVDNQTYNRLVDALATKPVIALVGAGLSMSLGYPSWGRLLRILRDRACEVAPDDAPRLHAIANSDDMAVVAGEYKKVLGGRLSDVIREIFAPSTPRYHQLHVDLLSLPLRLVLTTNYDLVLEECHANLFGQKPASVVMESFEQSLPLLNHLADHARPRTYVHIHGSVAEPETVILTKSDYDRIYVNDERVRVFLHSLFTVHTVVFLGFSMTDADVMGRFRDLASMLGASEARHFAVIERPPPEKVEARRLELRERYHVTPIFYDGSNNHAALPDVFAKLAADVKRARNQAPSLIPADLLQRVVGELLRPEPGVLEEAGRRITLAVMDRISGLELHDATGNVMERVPLDSHIDAIFAVVEQGSPDAAIAQYEAILNSGQWLTDRLKYRLHANIGNALFSKNQRREAADAYRRAASYYTKSRDARAIEIFGYLFADDLAKAQELSVRLCADEPDFARAHSTRLQSLPPEFKFADAESSVPEHVRSDPEVALALAERAGREDLLDVQERYARAAFSAQPDWLDALSAVATVLLISEKQGALISSDGLIPRNTQRVEEAERLLTKALSVIPVTDPMNRRAGMLFNRSMARRLLGKKVQARTDVLEAYKLRPDELEIALVEAVEREASGDTNGAITCMENLSVNDGAIRRDIYLALCLADRNSEDDRPSALRLMEQWYPPRFVELDRAHRADVARLTVRLLLMLDRTADAREFLTSIPSDELSRSVMETQWARIALAVRDDSGARSHAVSAYESLSSSSDWFEQREVAAVLEELQLWSNAFRIWKRLAPPGRFGSDERQLLRAAHFANEEAFILERCAALRQAGVHERECYQHEADILARHYETSRAIELLRVWLDGNPDDRDMRLSLSILARQTGNDALAEDDPSRLPSVDAIENINRGGAVVYVLRYGTKPETAIAYAYELWRRFPDEMIARRALVTAVFDPKAPPVDLHRPTTVEVGCAVLVQQDEQAPTWVFIEPEPGASITRGEYPPDHALTRALLGRSQGQEFSYADRTHRIIAVDNRIIRRAQECLDTFQEVFPDEPFVRKVRPNFEAPGNDPREKLGEVWKELERQEAHRKRLEGLHREHRLPVASVALHLGRTAFDTMRYFASSHDLGVHCSSGETNEWNESMRALAKRATVVIDPTAVATIYVLQLEALLSRLPFKIIVPNSVIDELRNAIVEITTWREPRGVIGAVNNRLYWHEFSAQEMVAEVRRLEGVLETLKQFDSVGGLALLSLESELRNKLTTRLGAPTAEAIATAREREACLWSDDLVTGLCGRQLLQVPHTWTQLAMRHARDRERITTEQMLAVTSKLLLGKYSFTGVSARDIVRLVRRSQWSWGGALGAALFRQAVEIGAENPDNAVIYGFALAGIWKECPSEKKARRLIGQLLDGLGRESAKKYIVDQLADSRESLWGIDHEKWGSFRRALRRWRRRAFP